jgi:hypothetical protein
LIGLPAIPQPEELSSAYERLYRNRPGTEELIHLSRWSRFDARLGEIWVEHLSAHWKDVAPQSLAHHNLLRPWPRALGVLLDTTELLFKLRADKGLKLFKSWKEVALHGLHPPRGNEFEIYFFGLGRLSGKLVRREVRESVRLYLDWGYFGRTPMINKYRSNVITLVPLARRRLAQDELAKRKIRFNLEDYRRFLGFNVSVRQAERDLAENPRIRARGNTKGRVYIGKG